MSSTLRLGSRRRGKAPVVSGVTPFFSDDFAGLQKNDANGFTWGSASAGVSVVSFDGRDCLRFRYPGVPNTPNTCEQRFALGRDVNALWMEYDFHVPSSFALPGGLENNKFFVIFRDNNNNTPTGVQAAVMEYWQLSGSSQTKATGRAMLYKIQAGTGQYANTDIVGDASNQTEFIGGTGPVLLGAWNQIRVGLQGSSAFGVSDGFYKIWVNGTLFTNVINHPIHNRYTTPTDVVFNGGYLMGSADTGYAAQTDFHLADPKFYDTNPGW